jgi:aerobic carbon-monoxide dehydrogenase medium subunit
MMPPPFAYEKPETLAEAVALLERHGADARLLAGGQSLLLLLKARTVTPRLLVDLGGLADLRQIGRADGALTIGALATQTRVAESAEVRRALPLIPEAAAVVADPMVRNRGTFGGSLAYADPAGDWPAVALALDARLHVAGADGPRTIPAADFFLDSFTTALHPTELLTHVELPLPSGAVGTAYRKLRHPSSGYALVGVAAQLARDFDGTCRDCRVAVTGAGRIASRARAVEAALHGQRLSPEAIAHAAEQASDGIEFLSDLYAGPAYRDLLVRTYVERALLGALASLG